MKKAYSKGLKYHLSSDKSYFVMGIGTCKDKNINIPPLYRGKPVSAVWSWSFNNCTNLRSITIPSSVTNIGWGAFYFCKRLTSITIPESVTSIEDNAFDNCQSLTDIMIPNSVTSIGHSAFRDCNNLVSTQANYKAFRIGDKGNLVAVANPEVKFKIGKKTYCTGELTLCRNGIHYCTDLFDIFNYYCGEYGVDFVITECEVSDENVGYELDSKRCARWVKPIRIIPREEVIYIMNNRKQEQVK